MAKKREFFININWKVFKIFFRRTSCQLCENLIESAKEVHENYFSGLPVFTKNNDSVFYFFIYMDPQFNLVNRIIEILRNDLPEDVFEFNWKMMWLSMWFHLIIEKN